APITNIQLGEKAAKTPEEAALAVKMVLSLSWSPDGRRLAYARFREEGSDLELLEVATGQATRLAEKDQARLMPSWSPNGREIAFLGGKPMAATPAPRPPPPGAQPGPPQQEMEA